MFDAQNLKEWSPDPYMVGYPNIIPWTSSSGSQLLFIPAIMPHTSMGQGKPKTITVGLNKSIFANDSGCYPSASSSITIQNYITVPLPANQSFKQSVFYPGTRVIVECLNENVDTLQLHTLKEDNSSEPY